MAKYSNTQGINLPMAVWLARDEYEHDDRTNVISVTTLLKSTRQIILGMRASATLSEQETPVDISTRLASRIGTSIHNSVEQAWTENGKQALLDLGYPQKAVDCVLINPEIHEVNESSICMYLEKRSEKQVGNWVISGQFDIVFDGQVQDVKSTGTFAFTTGSNDDKYTKQGSLYRWLNPDLITKDTLAINFVFKDWNKNLSMSDPRYPKLPVLQQQFPLISLAQTQIFVEDKVNAIEYYMDKDEAELPACTNDDTWRRDPVYKYYSKPDAKRSSKNFDTQAEAYTHMGNMSAKNPTGRVEEVMSSPTGCMYCAGFKLCSQAKAYVASGELKI